MRSFQRSAFALRSRKRSTPRCSYRWLQFWAAGSTQLSGNALGFDYTRDYGTSFLSANPHAEVNASLVAYSRFGGNTIGFNNAFYDARLTGSLPVFVGAALSFDTHRDFANNYAEADAGFLVPLSPELDVTVAGVEGAFLSRGAGIPHPPSYSS
jgi:hypothetical protein